MIRIFFWMNDYDQNLEALLLFWRKNLEALLVTREIIDIMSLSKKINWYNVS